MFPSPPTEMNASFSSHDPNSTAVIWGGSVINSSTERSNEIDPILTAKLADIHTETANEIYFRWNDHLSRIFPNFRCHPDTRDSKVKELICTPENVTVGKNADVLKKFALFKQRYQNHLGLNVQQPTEVNVNAELMTGIDVDSLINQLPVISDDQKHRLKDFCRSKKDINSWYKSVLDRYLKLEDVLINTVKVCELLNKNLSLSDNVSYSELVKTYVDNLGIDSLLEEWVSCKVECEILRPIITMPVYCLECQICKTSTNGTNKLCALDPCGHVFCQSCSANIIQCCYCRAHINKRLILYT